MTGDGLHSTVLARYPELSPRFDVDGDASGKDVAAFSIDIATGAPFAARLIPWPSIGRVTRWDDGFRWDFVEA
jgi:hypothetical protein